ncbi:MAG TPA: radical SAM protein, partial [Clostridia bacterium]|nr:radical SAM protein [Clostridia bacterium]
MTKEDTDSGKKVAIYTLGCKVNQYESATFAGLFKRHGYRVVDFHQPADIYIINTCTVTHGADRKSRQAIRRAIKTNPEAKIVVTGCYAQISPEDIGRIPGVDVIIGTQDRKSIVKVIDGIADDKVALENFEEDCLPEYNGKTRAFVKIQDGCESYCSYCIIPYSRGPLHSRKPENIVTELESIIDRGYREIVLTGIHAGAYGNDLPGDA